MFCEVCKKRPSKRSCSRKNCGVAICKSCFDSNRECCAKCSPVMVVSPYGSFQMKTDGDVLEWIRHCDLTHSMHRSRGYTDKGGLCEICGRRRYVTPMPCCPKYQFFRNYFLLGLEVSVSAMTSMELALEEASKKVLWKLKCPACRY